MQTIRTTEADANRKPLERVRSGEDREMKECLARLKVWQTENLMAPHGMDRFADANNRPSGDE